MELELRPFQVPNFAIQVMPPGKRQDGFKEAPSWALRDLDAATLDRMCNEFRAAVFEKAGKPDPRPLQGGSNGNA